METWAFFIAIFVGAWVLQIILTYYQNQHYSQTVREMSSEHDSGYLGVGVIKKRLGIGSVVILVSNLAGKVVSAKELTGVTVFARFQPADDLIGKEVDQLVHLEQKDHRSQAISMAAERIRQQREKEENEQEDE
ncbi:glucitol operon activator protein [Seinonella peptonophila]|uniref:Glucitol operon activator protein n=1 Tax=Seinonella peptonophila TaxID=112248 RepID=A0A1M4WD56_9BACL|nr:transcriptional regulator GutM [Seinonella peptonophila]SHE79166.1 glucitol operon activator protein [Seinonella peptonophila]